MKETQYEMRSKNLKLQVRTAIIFIDAEMKAFELKCLNLIDSGYEYSDIDLIEFVLEYRTKQGFE